MLTKSLIVKIIIRLKGNIRSKRGKRKHLYKNMERIKRLNFIITRRRRTWKKVNVP